MPKMKYTTYNDLLEFAEQECDTFSLVWRHEMKFKDSAWEVVEELQPYLISELPTNKWPGTEIFGGKALLRTYSVNPASIAILKRASSVFDWVAPNYPEDLALYINGKNVFASVAHESMAWFEA
jgi:hypothetical protein